MRSPADKTRLLGSCFVSTDRQTDLNQCQTFTCRTAETPQKLLRQSQGLIAARYKCFYTVRVRYSMLCERPAVRMFTLCSYVTTATVASL